MFDYKDVTFFYVTFVTFFHVDERRIRYYRKSLLVFANETNVQRFNLLIMRGDLFCDFWCDHIGSEGVRSCF